MSGTLSPQNEVVAEFAEIAGGFIHEIKNHIGTLALSLQLLAEEFENPQTPQERRALDRVQKLYNECSQIVDISNDFLRFARAEDLHRELCRIEDVIGEMIDFFLPTAKQKSVEILWYPGSSGSLAFIDRELFKQALLNLLLNAEQAMPNGGEIILQIRSDEKTISLDVIDTGCGIPADLMPKLFRPFHTTKSGGNGLGLPTVRKIIQAHGGKLEVQSEVGHGTKFTLILPRPEAEEKSE